DGDGDDDLVTVNVNALTWLADLTSPPVAPGIAASNTLCAGDLDGDGRDDVVYTGPFPGYPLSWVRVTGSATFTAMPGTMPTGLPHTLCAAAADLDGDGDPDLIVRPSGNIDRVRIFRNDGAFTFVDVTGTDEPWTGLPASTGITAVGDVDLDGDLDLTIGPNLLHNLDRHLFTREQPTPGATWRVLATQRPINAGFSAVVVGIGLLTPAVSTPFGDLRVDPAGATIAGPIAITLPEPQVVYQLPIPNLPALQGFAIFAQHVVVDGAGVELAGAITGVVQ
ncbi:MAG: VCBS repeat-containing protein, partial [Planctomycetes bacterium]|nr:VCBS repeat-containing protein [Planctomycetota bacterium]